MLPPSLEVSLWVAVLLFPLIQVTISIIAWRDIDIFISFGADFGPIINAVSFLVIWYPIIHSIVFLCSDPSGWNITASIFIIFAAFFSTITLLKVQHTIVTQALKKAASSITNCDLKKPRKKQKS
jgi:hypothetical protein